MAESETVSALTSETPEKLSGAPLVVVDFWAPWCGPCRRLAPVYEELAGEMTSKYDGRVQFYKVNVDEESAMAGIYGITTIPTLIGFSNGKPLERCPGRTKEDISNWIDKLAKDLGI